MNAKENSRKSFDLQAATYDIDRNGSHARTAYGPVMDRIKDLRCRNILDVGCGTGEILKRIIGQDPSARCTGMDISEVTTMPTFHCAS